MPAPWRLSNRNTGGVAATVTLAAPAAASGMVVRLLSIQAAMTAGAAAASDQLQVLDGATVIWQMDLGAPANSTATAFPGAPIDVRASLGNSMTVRFLNGTGSTAEDVNAQGDLVQGGANYYGVS